MILTDDLQDKLEALEDELSSHSNQLERLSVEECRAGCLVILLEEEADEADSFHRVRVVGIKDGQVSRECGIHRLD